MSGLFKNFQRILSNSAFTNPNHRYLVNHKFSCFNPAALFFNRASRDTGLKPGHSYDLFSLAQSSYELVRQTLNYNEILQTVSAQANPNSYVTCFKSELEQEISQNNTFINDALRDIVTQLKSGATSSLPVGCAVGIITVLSETNNYSKETSAKLIEQYLAPVIVEKAGYLSTQNFIDVFVGLSQLGLTKSQKSLWEALFAAFDQKTLEWEHQRVLYHGWETQVYETSENTQNKGEKEFFASDMERYWIDLKNGNAYVAQAQRWLRCMWRWENFYVYYPFFFREKRVNYQFDCQDSTEEQDRLFKALQDIQAVYPEKVDGIRKRL